MILPFLASLQLAGLCVDGNSFIIDSAEKKSANSYTLPKAS
jgi:hypothetical protein